MTVEERPVPPLAPTQRLGQFELVAKLGAGGMGEVWEAVDGNLGRRVALKLVRLDRVVAATRSEVGRALPLLRDEAQTMAKLQHPNIAVVHDIDAVDDRVFIAMELLSGGTLRQWRATAGRTWREIVAMYSAAGRGLDAAHRAGVVHRDFKPDNVLLGANGEVRVADFGIAALAETTNDSGLIVGTPGYMAPEQMMGRSADARADQFSFCVALYEALSGERPFVESAIATGVSTVASTLAAMTRRARLPRIRGIPHGLVRVVSRGLESDPRRRFASMAELLDAIDRAARRPTVVRRWIAAVVGVAVVATALVFATRDSRGSCAALGARSGELWTAATAGRVHDAFTATGVPYGEAIATRVARTLDTWVVQWSDARAGVCEQSANDVPAAGVRADCLDAQLVQMRGRVRALTVVTHDVVDRALPMIELSPDECLQLADGPPADPRNRDELERLGAQVAELEDDRVSGGKALVEHAVAVIAAADRLGAPALALANRARMAAALAVNTGDCTRMLEFTAPVVEAAATTGQLALEAEAWSARLTCLAATDKTAGIDNAIIAARALVGKLRGSRTAARLLLSVGAAEHALGQLDKAEASCRSALAIADRLESPEEELIDAHTCLGSIHNARHETAAAVSEAEIALALRRTIFGPNHHLVANALDNVAAGYDLAWRNADAIAARQQAIDIRERVWGRDSYQIADSLRGLAKSLAATGKHTEAQPIIERALALQAKASHISPAERVLFLITAAEIWENDQARLTSLLTEAVALCPQVGPAFARRCVAAHVYYADHLYNTNDCRGALQHFDAALAAIATLDGGDPDTWLVATTSRGQCLIATGNAKDGLAALESANARIDQRTPPDTSAQTKFALARALLAMGQRQRAIELAQAAVILFQQANDTEQLGEARGWLANHGRQ